MSPDEVEREHREKLGDEFGGVYYALYTEVAWLHVKWREYCALYGTSPERIEILNRAAPRFLLELGRCAVGRRSASYLQNHRQAVDRALPTADHPAATSVR